MKKKNSIKKVQVNKNKDIDRITKLTILVIIIFLSFYFITALITGEIKLFEKPKEVVTNIQYDEILGGEIFNRSDKEYYVLMLDFSNTKHNPLFTLSSTVSQSDDHQVYFVDLEKGFNKYLLTEGISNITNNISELKVTVPTLVQVKDKKIVASFEGQDKIKKHLSSLIKE